MWDWVKKFFMLDKGGIGVYKKFLRLVVDIFVDLEFVLGN